MNHFKKTSKQLEKKRFIFFQIGLLIACGLTLAAFEWTSSVSKTKLAGVVISDEEWDIDYVEPFEKEKTKKEVDKIKPPKLKSLEFDIVPDDHKEIKEDDKREEIVPPKDDFKENEWKEKEKVEEEDAPRLNPEIMPEFKGGLKKLFKYLGDNIRYPQLAKEAKIQGTVHLQFTVGKKGEIKDVKILKGVNELLDKEAVRVVKSMPNWKPGKQSGRSVSVLYHLPICFKLKP